MAEFKKPSEAELKSSLTASQYEVTQKDATEPPFKNEYWNNHRNGIYVDVVSGEALFSSTDKFDSGTGWPSFVRPIDPENITTRNDYKLFSRRIEVRSRLGDSHLGHVFSDGPAPTGLRYCVNSAALRFVPVDDLEKEGYGKYRSLFQKSVGRREMATLAGGCFWGVEELLRKLDGVVATTVGYTGGSIDDPTYEKVKSGGTGHVESVSVVFDPDKISYEKILRYFFRLHDPTTVNRQGNDTGTQYRSAIFYHDEKQKETAERVKREVSQSGKWQSTVVTEIVPFSKFYLAEEHHQDYLQKNPRGYTCHYLRE